jgi:hypothetical protein
MKTILILIALVVTQIHVFAGLEADIPQKNRVVLESGAWMPTPAEAQRALLSIQAFLGQPNVTNKWKNTEIKKILAHTKQYRVQFVGILRDGRKIIWCNFFPAPQDGAEDQFRYWKQKEVMVADGGFGFWQIDYDSSSDKCSHFMSNGYV